MQKNCNRAKKKNKTKNKNWFNQAALWRVYVYLIISTSMQKEYLVANSVRQIKLRCAKYKFPDRSYNVLMQLPMQLIFSDLWDLDKHQTCAKGKSVFQFRSVWKEIRKMQKNCNRSKKYQKMVWPRSTLERICLFDLFNSHAKAKSSGEFRSPDKNPLRKRQICGTVSYLLIQLPMQLIFSDLWDLFCKLQACAKGKSILEFCSVSKEIQKCKKNCNRAEKYQNMVDRATLWRVYIYLISSTSMQTENPVANSVRQIKIRCAIYKFAERSHNFLMQLPIQLIFSDLWDLDKLQTCAKGKSILEFRFRKKGNPKNAKN